MRSAKAQKYICQKCKNIKYIIITAQTEKSQKLSCKSIKAQSAKGPKSNCKRAKMQLEKTQKCNPSIFFLFTVPSFASEVWRKVLHGQEGEIFIQIFVCIKNVIQICSSNRIFTDKNMHSYHIRIIYLIQIYLDILLYSFFISTFIFNTNIFEYSFVYFFICILIFQYKYI